MAGSKTILCIEDDRFISDMYTRALKNAGFEVDIVEGGDLGAKKAHEGNYDLILLDIWIPEKNGIEVLQELRGQDGKGLPNSKIVITTNYSQDDESRAAAEAKADGYFIKAEITPRKMVEIAKSLIGEPQVKPAG